MCVSLCVGVVVCVSGNGIGAAGVTAVAEALKVNTTVQKIGLFSEWCGWCFAKCVACGSGAHQFVCARQCHGRYRSHSGGGGPEGEHQCAEY